MLVEVYGDTAPTDKNKSRREWFQRFKDGDFNIEDKPCSRQPKNFEDKELEEEDRVKRKRSLQNHWG